MVHPMHYAARDSIPASSGAHGFACYTTSGPERVRSISSAGPSALAVTQTDATRSTPTPPGAIVISRRTLLAGTGADLLAAPGPCGHRGAGAAPDHQHECARHGGRLPRPGVNGAGHRQDLEGCSLRENGELPRYPAFLEH